MTIYIDDAAESPRPETSHPRFVALAPESFYSATDEFAPFGSDDGNDVLRDMEAWYEQRDPAWTPPKDSSTTSWRGGRSIYPTESSTFRTNGFSLWSPTVRPRRGSPRSVRRASRRPSANSRSRESCRR